MNGERILADTNALIRMFAGEEAVVELLAGADIHVSFITEIELLATSRITVSQTKNIRAFPRPMPHYRCRNGRTALCDRIPQVIRTEIARLHHCRNSCIPQMPLVTGDKQFAQLEKEIALFRV